MLDNIDNILQYQKLDADARTIELELSNTEERKKTRYCLQFLKDSEEKLKKMEQEAAELNAKYISFYELYEKNAKLIAEYTAMVDKSIDDNELNYLSKKYADLSRTISVLERDVKNIVAEAEKVNSQFIEYRAKLPSAKKQYAEAKQAFEELRKQREPEIIEIQRKKAELEKRIDSQIFDVYKELKKQNVKYPYLVELEGNNRCGGCRMEMPMEKLSNIDKKGFIKCESCHRIIYKA